MQPIRHGGRIDHEVVRPRGVAHGHGVEAAQVARPFAQVNATVLGVSVSALVAWSIPGKAATMLSARKFRKL